MPVNGGAYADDGRTQSSFSLDIQTAITSNRFLYFAGFTTNS